MYRELNYHEFTEGAHYNESMIATFSPATGPPPEAAAAAAAAPPRDDPAPPELPLLKRSVPVALFMPRSIPAVRKGDNKTEGEKWIECFEEKVVCDYLDEVFSPIRRWDRSQYSGNSTLNSRLLQYCVAKNNIETPDGKGALENVKAVGREHAQSKL